MRKPRIRPRGNIRENQGFENFVPGSIKVLDDPSYFDNRPDGDWLNPISMRTLQVAVGKKAKTVVLNGNEYSITYGITWKSKVVGDYEVVKLKRTDGFYVPFGYVSMKRIRDFDFENPDG